MLILWLTCAAALRLVVVDCGTHAAHPACRTSVHDGMPTVPPEAVALRDAGGGVAFAWRRGVRPCKFLGLEEHFPGAWRLLRAEAVRAPGPGVARAVRRALARDGAEDLWREGEAAGAAAVEASILRAARDPETEHVVLEVAAPGLASGWAPGSPGFVWWSRSPQQPVAYGQGLAPEALAPADAADQAVALAEFYYQYPGRGPQHRLLFVLNRLKLEYHSGLLVQWASGRTSVVELGWRNGVSGYRGWSDFAGWAVDPELPAAVRAELAEFGAGSPAPGSADGSGERPLPRREPQQFPPELVLPYDGNYSEVRVIDQPLGLAAAPLAGPRGPRGGILDVLARMALLTDRFDGPALHRHGQDKDTATRDRILVLPEQRRFTRAELHAKLLRYLEATGGTYSQTGVNCQTFSTALWQCLTGARTETVARVVGAIGTVDPALFSAGMCT